MARVGPDPVRRFEAPLGGFAQWHLNIRDIGSASILKDGRVVFNIQGDSYRILVRVNYPYVYTQRVRSNRRADRLTRQCNGPNQSRPNEITKRRSADRAVNGGKTQHA